MRLEFIGIVAYAACQTSALQEGPLGSPLELPRRQGLRSVAIKLLGKGEAPNTRSWKVQRNASFSISFDPLALASATGLGPLFSQSRALH